MNKDDFEIWKGEATTEYFLFKALAKLKSDLIQTIVQTIEDGSTVSQEEQLKNIGFFECVDRITELTFEDVEEIYEYDVNADEDEVDEQ